MLKPIKSLSILNSLVFFSLATGCASHGPVVPVSAENARPAQLQAALAAERPRAAAEALLATFSEQQKAQAIQATTSPLRRDWHFVPRQRAGVMLGDLSPDQKKLAHNLLQTALSDSGYLKATDIIWLETVLYEMSNQNPMRDPGKYALLVFGDPSDDQAAWGWRLEGHHLSINLTYAPEGVGVTPLFMGTNPTVVQQGPLAGKRVLADAHHLAIRLASSMSDVQREQMMLGRKPRDIITGPGREASLDKPVGLSIEELSIEQVALLNRLIESHLNNYLVDHRDAALAQKAELGPATAPWNSWRFAWAGPIDADGAFYYRIHSPRFVIEYSCQNPNHVHAVMHDMTDPLQQDLLKRHFEQHPHQ